MREKGIIHIFNSDPWLKKSIHQQFFLFDFISEWFHLMTDSKNCWGPGLLNVVGGINSNSIAKVQTYFDEFITERILDFNQNLSSKLRLFIKIPWTNFEILFEFITEIVKQKGLENITVDDLVAEITPKGRGKAIVKLITRATLFMWCLNQFLLEWKLALRNNESEKTFCDLHFESKF